MKANVPFLPFSPFTSVEDKQRVANMTCIPRYLPEVTVGAHEFDSAYYAFKSLPGKKYAEGYNEDVGDKGIWLK
ncbi:hypothetical protein cypCar_00013085 [Cyprinus carpio]|nr:hypothetical protein cypCar_00013085 [Cyprinus carpio]